MTTLRRAASLATLTVFALGLAACDDLGPDTPEPTEPTLSIAVPERFASDAPSWDIASDLPTDHETATALSADGAHYAYAQRASDTITVTQIALATGERTEVSLDALEARADSTEGRVALLYSGSHLVVAHSGTSTSGQAQWDTALLRAGSSAQPKVLSETVEDGATVTLPSPASGPLINVTTGEDTTAFMVNTEDATISTYSVGEQVPFEGCGDTTNCNLTLSPTVQYGDTTVATFKEGRPASTTTCSEHIAGIEPDERSGFDYCLAGFMTDSWSSQDPEVTPAGAIPESAYLYASGDGYLIGSWRGEDGGTVYRTINVNQPGAGHAVTTCDSAQGGTGSHVLHRSPSGQYLAAGALLFDVHSGEGHCFEDGDVSLSSVSDSGVAWGASDSSWTPSRYASRAVSATMEGTVTPEGEGMAVPVSFVSADGADAGAFAVANDVRAGATVVAVYPFRA